LLHLQLLLLPEVLRLQLLLLLQPQLLLHWVLLGWCHGQRDKGYGWWCRRGH
jgi:hypothetical protein